MLEGNTVEGSNFVVLSKDITGDEYTIVVTGDSITSLITNIIRSFPNPDQVLAQVKDKMQEELVIFPDFPSHV